MIQFAFNISLLLTFVRLFFSPLLIILFIKFLPLYSFEVNCFLALIFFLISSTDFFDGFLARKLQQETILGSILDPIADKLLVVSALIGLVYTCKINLIWAIVIIIREFFVTALRQRATIYNLSLKVIYSAKIKTSFQTVYLIWVIINPYQSRGFNALFFNVIEFILLFIVISLSIYSAYQYLSIFNKHLKGTNDL